MNTEYHAPTVGPEEVSEVKKSNYGETFYRPPFIGTHRVDILDRFKRRKIDPKKKIVMHEKIPLIKVGPMP